MSRRVFFLYIIIVVIIIINCYDDFNAQRYGAHGRYSRVKKKTELQFEIALDICTHFYSGTIAQFKYEK